MCKYDVRYTNFSSKKKKLKMAKCGYVVPITANLLICYSLIRYFRIDIQYLNSRIVSIKKGYFNIYIKKLNSN